MSLATPPVRSRVRAARLSAVIALALLLGATTGTPVAGAQQEPSGPYLALGDSLPYGWDPVTPPFPVVPPSFHVGYPEHYAALTGLTLTNASCPGETSGSFLDRANPDNGCGLVAATLGLKTDWGTGSQLAFAVEFLDANPDTRLVSIQLGANDLFRCQSADGCPPESVAVVLEELGTNLGVALNRLRSVYDGPIVIVGYYALDYAEPAEVAIAEATEQVHAGLAAAFDDVLIADGFAALQPAAARTAGSACEAGLLLVARDGACDLHATDRGHRLLAQALNEAVTGSYLVCPAAPAASIDATVPADVTGVHAASITCAYEYGLVQGRSDASFGVEDAITRGQAASIIRRYLEVGSGTALDEPAALPFEDIAGTTHAPAIAALHLAGVIDGREDGTFAPGAPVTRPEFAKLLLNAMDHLDDPTTPGSLDLPDDVVAFDDVVGSTFQLEIQALAGAGIVNGVAERTFGSGTLSRGQAATLLLGGAVALDAGGRWAPTAAS